MTKHIQEQSNQLLSWFNGNILHINIILIAVFIFIHLLQPKGDLWPYYFGHFDFSDLIKAEQSPAEFEPCLKNTSAFRVLGAVDS